MTSLPAPVLHRLAQVRLGQRSLDEVLGELAAIAEDALPAVDAVSVTLLRKDRGWTAAYTQKVALELDERQYELGHGPCLDAARGGVMLEIADMAVETRWPEYTPRGVKLGIPSSLSVPVPLQSGLTGAMNIYSTQARAFTDADRRMAEELAAFVGIACANAEAYSTAVEEADQLRTAMASRAVIEQAKGIIMAQNRCDADRAFEILRQASMQRNVKLRELAEMMVQSVSNQPNG